MEKENDEHIFIRTLRRNRMIPKLYEVRDRSGRLVIENATSGEIRDKLHCTSAQINNSKACGDYIFRKYQVKEVDRKLSVRLDISLLMEFDIVRLHLLGYKKGDRK